MGQALVVLQSPADYRKVHSWVERAPKGTRIVFKGVKRTLPQNDRMWAMLTDVASQKEHCGRKYTAGQWKVLFLHACGREVQFIPSLDGSTFLPWGQSSSDLSKAEFAELLDFIESWGVQNGVVFSDPKAVAA